MLFPASRSFLHSLAHGLLLHLQSQQGLVRSFSNHVSGALCFHCHFSDSGAPTSLLFQPRDGSELTRLTQDHLPSSRLLIQSHLQSPFCHRKVTYAQVLGITIGTSLGWGIIILPTTRRRGHGYVHSCCKHILSASCMPSCSRSQRHRGTRQTITPASRSPNSSETGRQEHDQ